MKASVIVSTYNSKEWLAKVLWGLHVQTNLEFEVVIADDGSRDDTREMIDELRPQLNYPITHVWHEDNGFQKTQILNKAIVASKTDYLIFTDGDCIVRKDFVQTHLDFRKEGHFLSGGYFKLPMSISKLISKDDILTQRCFDIKWLKQNGLTSSIKNLKLTAKKPFVGLLNFLTPTSPTWNGHNASGWKKDLVTINGFNEEMQYGGEDRELGERLVNLGIKPIQIRYSAICLHLDHKRGYNTPESIQKNINIRKKTRSEKIIRTPIGIEKL